MMSRADPQPRLGHIVEFSYGYGRHAVNAIIDSNNCKTVYLHPKGAKF